MECKKSAFLNAEFVSLRLSDIRMTVFSPADPGGRRDR
ncbi:Hypothetical protein EAG7_03884 [Klebsiella aerogenes]|nr:Hypothetical protein EAG7_03884 [Klebsiella aerogenes]CCG32381.1 hypothetical protein [Klebsiella aerogenes EA1509E]